MADKRNPKQEDSSQAGGGGGQVVVSLKCVNEGGLTFFSRHRFEVASEIQMRVRWSVLPHSLQACLLPDNSGWVTVRGFVIECQPERLSTGAAIFQVSLVLDVILLKRATHRALAAANCVKEGQSTLFGLN